MRKLRPKPVVDSLHGRQGDVVGIDRETFYELRRGGKTAMRDPATTTEEFVGG